MFAYLKERKYYEDLYDKHTVESARRGMVHYEKFFRDIKGMLDKDDTIDRPGNAIVLNAFYMQTVGLELLDRFENREQHIIDWMTKDDTKDLRLSGARLKEEPICPHCHKNGLRIKDKSLMHKGNKYKYDDPEHVLFTLHCPNCDKNCAYWEDGSKWEINETVCPKCKSSVRHKTTRSKKYITITYTCKSCSHSFVDKINLSVKKEEPDPEFENDRNHFCLIDKEFREHLLATKKGFEDMAKLGKELQEKRENKHIYDAVKEMKKPKIAELSEVLSPVLDKEGFIEFTLEKPEMGRDVYIGFSCLDGRAARADHESEKTLKKIVQDALKLTNWRLMSDGISYRLGYLSGRLRAYEREEDLVNLVNKRIEDGSLETKSDETISNHDGMIAPDGTKILF